MSLSPYLTHYDANLSMENAFQIEDISIIWEIFYIKDEVNALKSINCRVIKYLFVFLAKWR